MAFTTPQSFNCSLPSKTYNLTFSVPAVAPKNGYLVRWKLSTTVSGWDYEAIVQAPLGIIQVTVPPCFTIVGEVKPYCGSDNTGSPIYGIGDDFTIAATATYTALISQASCNAGLATFNLSGTGGQAIRLRLAFGGSFSHNNTSGNCAWLTGEITDNVSNTANAISSAVTTSNTQQLAPEITVIMPSTGNMTIQTKAFAHNILEVGTLSASVKIVSVDNVTVNINATPTCVGYLSTPGCAP